MASRYVNLQIGQIIQPLLNVSNPLQAVTWHSYVSETIAGSGRATNTYADTVLQARVQPISHDMVFKHNLEFGNVYKRFYVLTDTVQTPDRNISTSGDYLSWNGLFWRVMRLPDEFLTGWQEIIGMQSTFKAS
jgi:hypothetical protein